METFKNQDGVTLIELLVSIVILTIILLSFMTFFTNSFHYNSISKDKLNATNLARETQEQFKEDIKLREDLISLYSSIVDGHPNYEKAAYDHLTLDKNIEIIDGKFKLTLTNNQYDLVVFINTTPESSRLFKLNVQVLDGDKLLSETFTYIEL